MVFEQISDNIGLFSKNGATVVHLTHVKTDKGTSIRVIFSEPLPSNPSYGGYFDEFDNSVVICCLPKISRLVIRQMGKEQFVQLIKDSYFNRHDNHKDFLVHEFIHVLQQEAGWLSKSPSNVDDWSKYVNSPHEFDAFFHTIIRDVMGYLHDLESITDRDKQLEYVEFLGVPEKFKDFLVWPLSNYIDFYKNLSPKRKKRFLGRMHNIHQYILKREREIVNGETITEDYTRDSENHTKAQQSMEKFIKSLTDSKDKFSEMSKDVSRIEKINDQTLFHIGDVNINGDIIEVLVGARTSKTNGGYDQNFGRIFLFLDKDGLVNAAKNGTIMNYVYNAISGSIKIQDTLFHEIIHAHQDNTGWLSRSNIESDYKKYLNSPHEFDAFYQTIVRAEMSYVDLLKTSSPEDIKDYIEIYDYPATFPEFIKRIGRRNINFVKNLKQPRYRRYLKRIFNLFQEIKKLEKEVSV